MKLGEVISFVVVLLFLCGCDAIGEADRSTIETVGTTRSTTISTLMETETATAETENASTEKESVPAETEREPEQIIPEDAEEPTLEDLNLVGVWGLLDEMEIRSYSPQRIEMVVADWTAKNSVDVFERSTAPSWGEKFKIEYWYKDTKDSMKYLAVWISDDMVRMNLFKGWDYIYVLPEVPIDEVRTP